MREVPVRKARTLGRPVDADVAVPGSKSLANRALICAALAAGESVLTGCPDPPTLELPKILPRLTEDRKPWMSMSGFPHMEASMVCTRNTSLVSFIVPTHLSIPRVLSLR